VDVMSAPEASLTPGPTRPGHLVHGNSRSLVAGRRIGTGISASVLHARGLSGDVTVDMEGWLTKVKALDGRAVRLPEKRWVVLQGTTLSWYKDAQCEQEASSQDIAFAQCVLPQKRAAPAGSSEAATYQMSQAMSAFAKLNKFPFTLTWPNQQSPYDFVFAASTGADRAAWTNALTVATERAAAGAPSAGWLFKEGGRKSGLAISGWKRRWFVLPQGSSELFYYESPTSQAPRGSIKLMYADVFVPKQVKGIRSDYKINLCIASEGRAGDRAKSGKKFGSGTSTLCTLLAAATHDERDKWFKTLFEASKPKADGSVGR